MTKDIKLQVPESVYASLLEDANRQGVSVEALCFSLIQEKYNLIDPSLYNSLSNLDMKQEIQRVLQSNLPSEEMKSRVRVLENKLSRFIR